MCPLIHQAAAATTKNMFLCNDIWDLVTQSNHPIQLVEMDNNKKKSHKKKGEIYTDTGHHFVQRIFISFSRKKRTPKMPCFLDAHDLGKK